MPLRPTLCFILAVSLLAPGCLPVLRQQAFPVSPFNGYASDYHPLPGLSDSAHTAVYAQGAYLLGGANEKSTDYVSAFRTSLTVAHHFGQFQAFYGGDLTLGKYFMGKWDSGSTGFIIPQRTAPPANAGILNSYTGGKFFGGAGFHGGVNAVIPTRGGEWRILGLETALHQEFGDYLGIRKKLPDSAVTLIDRSPFFATLGLSTELVGYTQHGEFGFRLARGWDLGNTYSNPGIWDNLSRKWVHYTYTTLSFHYTSGQFTGYFQYSGATKASSVGIGIHYRMGRPGNVSPVQRRTRN